ncbi:MAG: nucleotide exchange factor GrpE [Deltaproteobacteria bacterium]|nr:nucleotide exchange factor GrpE [Deltaproteobacteria bacterium]
MSDDDLGFPEEELEALFAAALADNEPATKTQSAPDPGRPRSAKRQSPPPELFGDIDIDVEAELNSAFDAVPEGTDATGEFDELDRELAMALAGEDDEDQDLEASMKALLADSMDDGPSDGSPTSLTSLDSMSGIDLESVEPLPMDVIMALGPDGAVPISDERDVDLARLRSRVHELERNAALLELELRTKDDRVETLEQQVIAATRQSAGITREFDAFRRRSDRDKDDLKKFAAEKVLKEFLVVFDNLRRALDHSGEAREGAFGKGVEMTVGQFLAALRRCGVEEVNSSPGEVFDPQWHEAVGQEHSDDIAEGAILNSMMAGFTLNDRLLRAAMVSVSRGPAGEKTEPAPTTNPQVATLANEDLVAAKAAKPVAKRVKKTRKSRKRTKKADKE